jgi:hypothetical protein
VKRAFRAPTFPDDATTQRLPKPISRQGFADNPSVPRIKAFCAGQAKSGTASLSALLSANHRTAHEPEREQILKMILRESRGDVSENVFKSYLLARDNRFLPS